MSEHYSTAQNKNHFEYLRHSDFNQFFTLSKVDTPRCLLNTWSSRRTINRHLLIKLSNYISRKGKREQTLNLLLNSLRLAYLTHLPDLAKADAYLGWKSIYTIISSSQYTKNYSQFPPSIGYANVYACAYGPLGKEHSSFLDMRNVSLTNINSITPIFSFYIYKVDKAIYKNSRGRSGKYTFIWKYLPPYKRRQLVLAWIAREVKLQSGRTIQDRVDAVIKAICFSPTSLFINKVQTFSTNYVYRNSRKSLCETYRTTTK